MKTFYVVILFFVFALRPIYTIGYATYFELNLDYIIEKYCANKQKPELQCKGKCHLAKQLMVDGSQKSNAAFDVSNFSESFFPVFFKHYQLKNILFFEGYTLENNWRYNKNTNALYKDHLDPPPKYLLT